MDKIIDKIMNESKSTMNKLSNDVRNELMYKFSVDKIGSEGTLPLTIVNVHKGKKAREIHAAGLTCLWDGGASHSIISYDYVKKFKSKFRRNVTTYDTAGGEYKTKYDVKIDFTMPEFSSSRIIRHRFHVDQSKDRQNLGYDVILGRDIMIKLGLATDFARRKLVWDQMSIPMWTVSERDNKSNPILHKEELRQFVQQTAEPKVTQNATKRMIKILDSDYKKADLEEIAFSAEQLHKDEQLMLLNLLKEFEDLFDGTLGKWRTEPVHIELKEGAKPVSSRYYPVPHVNKETFKKELLRLVEIGVLTPVQESEYGTPVFIIPKKEGTVRFVTDFRRVNKNIVRKPYPIPRIGETMQQLDGFQFATALDLNMGYYTIQLDAKSKDITTIVTEFGKFRYNVLPMGLVSSGDIFQAKVNELLGDIEGVKAYIDDILVLNKGTFKDHVAQLRICFQRIRKAGLKINAKKCSFGLKEIPYLGYIITRDGIKPDPKKVQGILDIEKPKTTTECRKLIGMVQYYRDMWKRRSHILAPLTEASVGKKGKPIKWTDDLEQAFLDLKKMVSEETILNYPDWTQPFDVHTDASDKQLGAVVSQNNKPIAFFSRRLSKAQCNYTTTEKELLSIVECLKQFKGILFGYEINVFSDHKNLVYEATLSQSQRVMRWRLILEEFGPNIQHIAGLDNVVADTLSRLPSANTDEKDSPCTPLDSHQANELFALDNETESFPLSLSLVHREQQKELNKRNSKLKPKLANDDQYTQQELEDIKLIFYNNKIYVPQSLRRRTLNWYHFYLNHPGGERLAATLKQVCNWKGITNQSRQLARVCEICQKFKRRTTRYGHLPPKIIAELKPWDTVHIDLIGPYSVYVKQHKPGGTIDDVDLHLTCMTFIDPATGWFEICEVPYFDIEEVKIGNKKYISKTSARISQLFNNTWLSRYPRPRKVIFDNGSEFKRDFVPLLKDFDIKPVCTTIENPQANGPVERVHQVIHNMIVTKDISTRVFDYIDPWTEILSSVAWAIRASHHSTFDATPAQLVFGRDMIFNLATVVDWRVVSARKQTQVDRDNLRENAKRISYDYAVGDRVFVKNKGVQRKLDPIKHGPYTITEVHTNGTVRIQRQNFTERINIRRLEPFFEEE